MAGPAQGPDAWPADLAREVLPMPAILKPVIEESLFRALADRTRREIVARALAREEGSVPALGPPYRTSFAAGQ